MSAASWWNNTECLVCTACAYKHVGYCCWLMMHLSKIFASTRPWTKCVSAASRPSANQAKHRNPFPLQLFELELPAHTKHRFFVFVNSDVCMCVWSAFTHTWKKIVSAMTSWLARTSNITQYELRAARRVDFLNYNRFFKFY